MVTFLQWRAMQSMRYKNNLFNRPLARPLVRPLVRRVGGFTLLEMLLALLLFAIASSLVWQALATLARVERRLADSSVFASDEALRRQWVVQALAGVMNAPGTDALQPRGSAQVLEAVSSAPPWPGAGGGQAMRLLLEQQDGGQTVLWAQPIASSAPRGGFPALGEDALLAQGGKVGQRWELLRWPGRGQWRYLDAAGQWQDVWPPLLSVVALGGDGDLPPLKIPKAIALLGPPGGLLLAAPQAGDNPMPSQRELLEEP